MGYTSENIKASNEIMSNLRDWVSFRVAETPVTWPRHGLFELIFEMPFQRLDKLSSSDNDYQHKLAAESKKWGEHLKIEASGE